MSRILPRVAVALVLVVGVITATIAAPAWACACGAYIPDADGPFVVDEKALIRWDGTTEDIVMALGVSGRSAKAAWIMPVPSEAEVTLAEENVFTELKHLTRPRYVYRDSWWPNLDWLRGGAPLGDGAPGGAGDGGVVVRGQQRIGPFEVTRLGADDPAELATWLGREGFPKPASLDADLAPYVQAGWETVAIRLVPADGAELGGQLQPLRLTFASDQVVYPMRLSRSAERTQLVSLYVLAQHRMDPKTFASETDPMELRYAGRVEPGAGTKALAPYLGGGMFLTRWDNVIGTPSSIDSDYTFAQATEDTTYQQVITQTRDRGGITSAVLLLLVVLAAIVLVLVAVRRSRGRMAT